MYKENPRVARTGQQPQYENDIENITEEEVQKALAKMKNGKAVGPDNIKMTTTGNSLQAIPLIWRSPEVLHHEGMIRLKGGLHHQDMLSLQGPFGGCD
jgi:hypothetical protein